MKKKITMQTIADTYNNEELNMFALERMIEEAGYISDMHEEYGVCHNDTQKVVINERGEAVVYDC